jgi:uncharacterized protein YbcV (DUF1398 family)
MALPIIAHFDGNQVQTQVRRNAEWNEYVVEFWYRDRVHTNRFAHRVNADYHTSDKQDALDTAQKEAK